MPGTQRTIAELEAKFKTGDVPTQQDFYDLFASYLHLQNVVQALGSSATDVMSQKAVTDSLVSLQQDIVTLSIYKESNFGTP